MWLQWLIAVGVLACLAPLVALAGRRYGARARAGLGLAAILLGFGEVADPPSKHLIEAGEADEHQPPAPGDPPTAP